MAARFVDVGLRELRRRQRRVDACTRGAGRLTDDVTARCRDVPDGRDELRGGRQLRLRADHDADAQYGLGVAYLEGKGVSPNLETAVSWFLKAANQQHLYAMFNVGTAYWIGRGIEQDRKEAVFWWRNAAHDGLPRAQYNIGLSYYYGEAGALR